MFQDSLQTTDRFSANNSAFVSLVIRASLFLYFALPFLAFGQPRAHIDSYAATTNDELLVGNRGVFGNDTDTEVSPLTAALVTDVSNGSLTLNGDGSSCNKRAAAFSGAASFTYLADDSLVDSEVLSTVPIAAAAEPLTLLHVHATVTSVTLTFNEPLDYTSATNVENYALDPRISASAALYQAGQNAVTLLTSAHVSGVDHTVTVANVEDTFGNAILPVATTYTISTSPLDTTASLWAPYLEWQLSNDTWVGNPYDVVANVTFTHTGSDASHSTEMFYDDDNTWRFRFSGTQLGEWRFSTASDDADLANHAGTVIVLPNGDPQARGFVIGTGNTWTWSGSGAAFVPQFVMYTTPDFFHDKPEKIEKDIETFLVEHGFNGFHVPGANYWFDINTKSADDIAVADPDPRTFEALELLIGKVYSAGGSVHIWAWGDESRRLTPTRWGINGVEDRRLQRYMAARLGPLPGWTMGYGFDLDEWVTESELHTWASFLRDRMGWKHLLGGRPSGPNTANDHGPFLGWNQGLGYSSYEHHKPAYDTYVAALDLLPDQPAFSEDRFRIRDALPKDYTMEETRRGLWQSTMAGGVANIWGHVVNNEGRDDSDFPSQPYPNPEYIKTYSTFFTTRFRQGASRCNNLTDAHALCYPSNEHFVFYKQDATSIQMNLSGVAGSLSARAVDAKKTYMELDLGTLSPTAQTWHAPYSSDWAIAVGDFGETPPDATPPSVPQGLIGTAISDTEVILNWQAAVDPRSGVTHYVVYRAGKNVGTSTRLSFTDSGLTAQTKYTYEVIAVNGEGLKSLMSEPVAITTLPPDSMPAADAGIDLTMILANVLMLYGTFNDEPLPNPSATVARGSSQALGPRHGKLW